MKAISPTAELREKAADQPAGSPATPTEGLPAMPSGGGGGLEPTIFKFILKNSLPQQLMVVFVTFASFPFLYYSLDLPKTIINKAISPNAKFPTDFLGMSFDRYGYLAILCGMFLALVFVNGGFKFYINVLKGRLGERMLRRLRYALYEQLLRFPHNHFKKVSPGEIIPMITSEVENLGGFIGDAFVLPLFQGGQLATIVLFMFLQDWVLGIAAIALYPVQHYLIPKLQKKTNQLGKQRTKTVRRVADKVSESISGASDLHANDGARLQLAQFSHVLGLIYELRFEIFQRKFFTKFVNNFIAQLTPFFFFSIGGYLVIEGTLTFGALVAVLAAYKDLASPWNELLNFYQIKEDARIKYEQVVEQFQPEGMMEDRLIHEQPDKDVPLTGEMTLANVTFAEDERLKLVDSVSASLPLNKHIAIVGQSSSGKQELAQMMARALPATSGRLTIGGQDMATLPTAVLGRRMGYVSSQPFLFNTTLRENLESSLRFRPVTPAHYEGLKAKKRHATLAETLKAGNLALDIEAQWIDFAAAGVRDEKELIERILKILQAVDFDGDVYLFGLRGMLNPKEHPEATSQLLDARKALSGVLEEKGLTKLVERYDVTKYNHNGTVAENLLFGTQVGPAFDPEALSSNTYVLQVLDKVGLTDDLVKAGISIAQTMVEMFADVPPGHEFFEQFSFIKAEDLPEFQVILGRLTKSGHGDMSKEDRNKLLSLPFKIITARHRLDVIDETMQARILEARKVFAADLPADLKSTIAFFDIERYNAAAPVQDNILFGKIAYNEAGAEEKVRAAIADVISKLDLRLTIIEAGLEFGVGTGGGRLSAAQRQKVALARVMLKRPDLLILNEATTALDGATQTKVLQAIKEEFAGRGLIWVLHRTALARQFDHVMVMSNAKIAEQGRYEELDKPGSTMTMLLAAE